MSWLDVARRVGASRSCRRSARPLLRRHARAGLAGRGRRRPPALGGDHRAGCGAVRRHAVAGVPGAARPRAELWTRGRRADDRRHRREAAGRPIHRGGSRRGLPHRARRSRRRRSCARRRAGRRGSRCRRRRASSQDRGIDRVVLVSDPFHSLRIRLIAEELGFDAVTSPTHTSPIGGFDEFLRYLGEALRVAFGRIFGFGRLARASQVGVAGARTRYPGSDLRGWCNRQHNRFWSCHWGFESSPRARTADPSAVPDPAPSSSGLGRRPLKAETAVRICSGLPHHPAIARRAPLSPRRVRVSRVHATHV